MAYGSEMKSWVNLLGAGIEETKGVAEDNKNNNRRQNHANIFEAHAIITSLTS